MGVPDAKRAMRAEVRARLAQVPAASLEEQSRALCARVLDLPEFARAGVVMVYAPMAGEADCRAVARAALAAGKVVVLPGIDWEAWRLVPRRVSSVDEGLIVVRRGVPEPSPACPEVDVGGIDLVVTPGLAFDGAGGRLGRGGGFYDRFLVRARPAAFAAGFALREQVVGEVPAEATDARVDAVVTPERTMRPRATDGGG